jgi:hypothetical protein
MVYMVEGATPIRLVFWGECWPKRPKARCYTCGRVCRGPIAWVGAPCVRAVRFQHTASFFSQKGKRKQRSRKDQNRSLLQTVYLESTESSIIGIKQ